MSERHFEEVMDRINAHWAAVEAEEGPRPRPTRMTVSASRARMRLAEIAEADTGPGYSLGMPLVTAIPAGYADLDYCHGCREDIDPDGECGCDMEATDTGPDLDAVEAHLASRGIHVMSLDEWAQESCPSLAAEAEAIRNATEES